LWIWSACLSPPTTRNNNTPPVETSLLLSSKETLTEHDQYASFLFFAPQLYACLILF
jgi:hypothetical protein